jgi:uncharacterized protein (TIGR00297 family)
MSPLLAVPAAILVAGCAWRLRAFDASGALAATLVGAAILVGQGWRGGALLLAFFIPTTLISRLLPDATSRWDAKGNRRDGWQVMANGGAAAVAALAWAGFPRGLAVAAASLAAAAADTWATTIGSGSRSEPRSIATGRRVPAGTSGGVSWRGTLGGTLGAAVVAAAGVLVSGRIGVGITALFCGIAGMLLDSLLGATLQGRFFCPVCQRPTERRRHRCGTRSDRMGGLPWLTNDGVNALATASAALVAALTGPAH